MTDARATLNGGNAAPPVEPNPVLDALAAAFQHVTIGMALAAPDGRLSDANAAFSRMLGYQRNELLGKGFVGITHPEDPSGPSSRWQALAAGEIDSYHHEKRYLRKDGSILWGHITVSALREEQGQFVGGLVQVQDITAQKTAESALRQHEAQLEALVSQVPVALYTLQPGADANFQYVSPRFERQTSLTRADLPITFAGLLERIHPDDRAAVQAADERATRTGEPAQVEYRLRGGNGEWIWVDNRSVLMRDEQGVPLVWHGALIDISERKRLEASLRESEERFRRAFTDAAIGMALSAPGDVCLDANAAYCQIVGRAREDLIGLGFSEITHPDDRPDAVRRYSRLEAGEIDAYETEKRYVRPDGTIVTGLLTMSAVRDETGALMYGIGQLQDITAHKATAAALRESEVHLRTIVEQLPAAIYRLEPGAKGRFTYASPRFAALSGLTLGHSNGDLEAYFSRVHPDDVQNLRAADAESGRTGRPLDLEYRLRGQDGSWIWVHDCSTLTRDEHGKPLAWHGVLIDISERKRLEASLRESEERFRSIFESAGVGMTLASPQGVILVANPAMGRLLGYAPQELAGMKVDALSTALDGDRLRQYRRRMRAGEIDAYQIEKQYRRKDGEIVWAQVHGTAIRSEQGVLTAIIGQVQDITARREAEAALRESEARFRSIFEGAGIGMALSVPQGRILVANPALERLLGYEPGELEGVRVEDISFPEDLANQTEHLRRMRAGELDAYEYEKRFVRKDGGVVWGYLNATAVKNERGVIQAIIGQVQDITARKEAEAALRESEARFRALVQNDPDVIAVVDAEGQIIYMSPSAATAFGISAERFLGPREHQPDIVHPEERASVIDIFAQVADTPGATASTEARLRHAKQGWRWFQVTIANQLQDPGIGGYVCNLRDITDSKEAALATAAALSAREAAIAELEQLNRSKSRFLSTISHEFRTPLTAIIGYSELLASGVSDPATIAEDATVIHREASRLNRMVDDVMLIDRVDAGHLPLNVQSIDLNSVVRDVVKTMRPLAEKHRLELELDPRLRRVTGDRDRLAQALTNLLGNAVKYSPAGGVVIIRTRNAGDEVIVSVQDDGIGIAARDLPRIFDRFERAESGIAGRIAGTGLGLAIVREIATLHHGRVWAESAPGAGSTFSLALPTRSRKSEVGGRKS